MGLSLEHLSVESAASTISQTIEQFRRKVGITSSLKDLGVNVAILPRLAAYALQDACLSTNPRAITKADMEVLYEQAL